MRKIAKSIPAQWVAMKMARKASSKHSDSTANLGFEAKLWLAADKLRNS